MTTFNCTLRSGYSLPTWGQCAGVRIGNVVIINAVMRSSADSTALYLSKYTTANKYMYGQLVYAVQD